MISFDIDDVLFNYRCAAISFNKGRVLLHRAHDDDFWVLPGGCCEAGESAREAVTREMREELDCSVSVGRLVFVVENFFIYNEQNGHEIGMYFEVELPQHSPVARRNDPWTPVLEPNATFKWFELDELLALCIKPAFLAEKLFDLPQNTEHIVIHDIPDTAATGQ